MKWKELELDTIKAKIPNLIHKTIQSHSYIFLECLLKQPLKKEINVIGIGVRYYPSLSIENKKEDN
jgi:hypothetical protein